MVTAVTIRDVPEDVRDLLAQQARERGQSLQAYLLGILRRQAQFSRNRELLAEIESELSAEGGGAGPEAPDSWEVLAQVRAEVGRVDNASEGRPRAST
jgi:antitoxin FitA